MDRQRQEFAKRSRVLHDAEYTTGRAVPAEPACAPFATAAGEIDFARDAFPALDHFTDEFVTRRARKAVVSALQLQIGGTNAGGGQVNAGEAFGDAGQRLVAHFDAARLKMNGKHADLHLKCLHLKNMSSSVQAELVCFESSCRERFAITEVLYNLSLIHISEPTRQAEISYAVFC